MLPLLLRPGLSLILCGLLACPPLPAQDPKKAAQASTDPHDLVKPDPKRARQLVETGDDFAASGNLERALNSYDDAVRYAPFDVSIVAKAAAIRAKLLRRYTDAAENFAAEGDFQDATVQLADALRVDPNNTIVLERMQQLASMNEAKAVQIPEDPPKDLPKAEPLKVSKDFNVRTDLRSAYEQVAAAYGLKASFDPDLPARNVYLRLQNVDFDVAMKVLAAESGTFWRALNPKLIFVAADTQEKRRAYDPQIEQTFPMPASVDPTEMTEIVRALRELTGIQHIQQSAQNHSVTVRDTVDRVRLAGAIIHEVEQARGEVLLEIDILEVDRSTARDLGITPPASLQTYTIPPNLVTELRAAPSFTALLTLLAQVFGTSALTTIPAVAVIGGGKSTFLLGLPTFAANFSDMLNLVQDGRQVLLRAQDGKPATFFVGERYPITLSLLSASLGASAQTPSVGGGPSNTVSTEQFTVGAGPVALATADFRAIGTQDLAVLNELDNTISILLNQGSGALTQFAPATGSPIALGSPRNSTPAIPAQLATGNLNPSASTNNPVPGGDNLPDLLVTDPVANNVTVLLQTTAANGTFLPPKTPITVGKQPSAIVTGTFNTNFNSNVGFVVTNFTDNTYSVFNGNGDGTFTPVTGSPFALPVSERGPYAITVADFNGDGISDLAIVNQTSNNVAVLQGIGNGTFKEFPGSPLPVGKFPVAIASGTLTVATGTLTGSTNQDLAVVNQQDNSLSVFLGNGDGTFSVAPGSPLATDTTPTGVAIANVGTASGIAVSNTAAGTVSIFADLGAGLAPQLEPSAGANPGALLVNDFTSSETPDVVVANNNNQAAVAGQVTLLISPASLIPGLGVNSQQPYPGSEYEDIGLKIKATPSLHANDEVTIQFEFDIKSLAGTNINGIPIITNRTLTQSVRLKENETSLIGGLLDRQETKTISGIPGLAELPGIGYAFGSRNTSSADTDFLILVTPRKVRLPLHESRSIYAGRGDSSGRTSVGTSTPISPQPSPAAEPTPSGNQPVAPTPAPEPPPTQTPGPPPPEPNPESPGGPPPPTPQPQEPGQPTPP